MTKPRDRMLAVLQVLSSHPEPIGLSDLMNQIEPGPTERTVRRWLRQLVEQGLVKKTGITKSAKYTAVKKSVQDSVSVSGCFSAGSLAAIEKIKRPIYERQPVAYNINWFESYQPNITFYLPEDLRLKLQKAGVRSENQDPAGTYAHQIYNRLLIDLSYNSSRLEGNTYSLLDTERLLLHGDSAEGKLDQEKVMILNHKEAIRFLVENAARNKVEQKTICTIHYLLADGLLEPKYAGKVRDYAVRIGGSTYIPYEDPRQLSSQLDKVVTKAAAIVDPFEQSLFLLAHLSYLQGFADVNKRTARISANIPLISKNLVPLSCNDVEVADYMSAMIAVYELQNITPLVDLYAYSYLRTCAAYDSTVKALGFDEVRIRYRQQRRALLRNVIVEGLTGTTLNSRIRKEAEAVIPAKDRELFMEDVAEDLEQMGPSRIAGLGVTPDQLAKWMLIRDLEA